MGMMRGFLVLLSLLVLNAAPNASADELVISNARFGLICPERVPEDGSVCVETAEIPITGQGVCVYAGVELPCTWYGFEFEYANAQLGDQIMCIVTTDQNTDYGDPTGVRARNTNRTEFGLKLDSTAGRYFNPQYTIFDPRMSPGATRAGKTVCSFGAREVFRFEWLLRLAG